MSQKEEKEALPKLYVTKGPMEGHEYELEKKTMFIGRSSGNDIKFKDIMVSRKHLKISRSGETFSVEDLKSTNGTMVNGETIEPGEHLEMEEGDTICLGNTTIQFGRIPVNVALDAEEMGCFVQMTAKGECPSLSKKGVRPCREVWSSKNSPGYLSSP